MADVFQDRDAILANFQACTGIDDFGECIAHLEQSNWNLTAAVNSVFSGSHETDDVAGVFNNISPVFRNSAVEERVSSMYGDSHDITPPLAEGLASWAHSSVLSQSSFNPTPVVGLPIAPSRPQRILKITVKYKSRAISVSIPDTHSVGKLKSILEDKTKVSKFRMQLSGFPQLNVTDTTVLSSLELPIELALFLTLAPPTHKQSYTGQHKQSTTTGSSKPGPTAGPSKPGPTAGPSKCSSVRPGVASTGSRQATGHKPTLVSTSTSKTERSTLTGHTHDVYTLNITNTDTHTVHTVRFIGSTTILKVKMDISDLTDITVARQQWTGWPNTAVSDQLTLSECGMKYPIDRLTVSNRRGGSSAGVMGGGVAADDSSDVDEFIDATSFTIDDDDINVCDTPSNTRKPLLPAGCVDDAHSMRNFTQIFELKYGDCHPLFFEGSLDEAVEHALGIYSCDEKKPLAIYLHHDNSIFSNIFCSEILCNEGVVSYLCQHFTTWAWDMTEPSNEIRIREWFENNLQSRLTSGSITAISADEYPLLLILTRTRTTLEILHVIKGDATLDNLMVELIQAYESFTSRRDKELAEERERLARDRVIQEQNEAYEASLRVDRAKSKAKEELEMNRRIAEQQAQEDEKMKEEKKQSFAMLIDEEPAEDSDLAVSRIKLRLPNGEVIIRRFRADSRLQSLLNYIASKGYSADEFKVLTAFPKKDLTAANPESTLTELQFCPQEMITIEEK